MTLLMSLGSMLLPFVLGTSAPEPQQQAAQTGTTRREPAIMEISGFSVVLLVGETQSSGGATGDQNVPSGAARAIKDMQEFLPFKHFRVLDTQWTSCCTGSSSKISGRLQGLVAVPAANNTFNLATRVYGFSINASSWNQGIPIRFTLASDDGGGGDPVRHGEITATDRRALERQRQDVLAELETLQAQIQEMRRRVEAGVVPATEVRPLEDRHASLRRKLNDLGADLEQASIAGSGKPIIDSSFTMQAGETVVVGTSRLGGDKALIALVTAVPRRVSR